MIGYLLLFLLPKEGIAWEVHTDKQYIKWDNRIPYKPGYVCNYEVQFVPNLNFILYTCVHQSKCTGHRSDNRKTETKPRKGLNFDNCPFAFYPSVGGKYVCCHPAANDEAPRDANITTGKHNDPKLLTFVPGFRSAFKCNDYAKLACLDTKFCPDSRRRGYKGGTETDIQKYPHLATMFWYNFEYNIQRWACLGSIVSEKFILSSNGCDIPFSDRSYFLHARVGDTELCADSMNCALSNYSQVFLVLERITPPQQLDDYYYDDLVLLHLNDTIKWNTRVRPACLSHELNTYQWDGKVAFYEQITKDGMQKNITSEFEIQIISQAGCNLSYGSDPRLKEPRNVDKEIMFCAGLPHAGRVPCEQDYGAPIQFQREDPYCTWMIYGVLAYSPDLKCKGQKPPIFTRVPYYIHWIEGYIFGTEFNIFEQYNSINTQCKDPLQFVRNKDKDRCRA